MHFPDTSSTPVSSVALNRYVECINQLVDDLADRWMALKEYVPMAADFRSGARGSMGRRLLLTPLGSLEEYYYRQAIQEPGTLPAEEDQELREGIQALWTLAEQLDGQYKTLDVYLRLEDYQVDQFQQSDALLENLQSLFGQFSQQKDTFQGQLEEVYQRFFPKDGPVMPQPAEEELPEEEEDAVGYFAYEDHCVVPHQPDEIAKSLQVFLKANLEKARADLHTPFEPAYRQMQEEMRKVLETEKRLLQSWSYCFCPEQPAGWPLTLIQQNVLECEAALVFFARMPAEIQYPASSMVTGFGAALAAMQQVKRDAVDAYTYEARQSAKHDNRVYEQLMQHFNQDLLVNYQSFVKFSGSVQNLLDYPKCCPVFALAAPKPVAPVVVEMETPPFQDASRIDFALQTATEPANPAIREALHQYVEFLNESVRQVYLLQTLLRDYCSSAEYHRSPAVRRSSLAYSYAEFRLPLSHYQRILTASECLLPEYWVSLCTQAKVLLNILKEMDGLSIELIRYVKAKGYAQDQLRRSDAVLERYKTLFDIFDQKKEQLYQDVRRIHESFPVATSEQTWQLSGKVLLDTLELGKALLLEAKAYLSWIRRDELNPDTLEKSIRKLLTEEYQNLKGLARIGRNNGLCPYSPYEDLAENARRFASKIRQLSEAPESYESLHQFFYNELVYPYNRFSELSKGVVLPALWQPFCPPAEPLLQSTEPEPFYK